jgi:putative ABC transport system permease protein
MWKTTLAGLRAHRVRLLLAALATLIGVAFVAGTLIVGDTLKANTQRAVTANTSKVDVAVLATSSLRKLPASLPDRLAHLPGVGRVQGVVEGNAVILGHDGRPSRDQPTGTSVSMRTRMAQGRAPASDDEVALARTTARDVGYAIGDRITVLDQRGHSHALRVTGLVDTTGEGDLALRGAVVFTPRAATAILGETQYNEVYVKASGTTPDRLRQTVAGAVDTRNARVLTGRQWASEKASDSGIDPAVLATGLLMFALVALMVAGLVIFNTFNILAAQRTRELALLRCVGASRAQVFASVVSESAITGACAAALGLGLGIGAAYGALPIFQAFGTEIPADVVTVTPLTLVLAPIAGLAVTIAAAALPARAATRVAAVTALNATPETRPSRTGGRVRIGFAVVLCVIGVLGGRLPLVLVAAGGMVFFLGVVVLGPVLIGPLVTFIGYLPRRCLGTPGRLAVANARRNPRRAATTTIALTVGVTLMTGISVLTDSFSASVGAGVRKALPVDYMISAPGTDPGSAIPPSIVSRLRAEPGVTQVAAQRESVVTINGQKASIGNITIGGPVHRPATVRGKPIERLGPRDVAVSPSRARQFGVDVGDKLQVRFHGHAFDVTVAAVVTGQPFPPFYMSDSGFTRHFGAVGYGAVLVNVAHGLSPEQSRAHIEAATSAFPTAKIVGAQDGREQLKATLSSFVTIIAGLLGLAVVISIIGIANTMTLSVVERTRESAMLRALGLTKRQLRRMLTVEALILGIVGAIVGVVLGGGFGMAAARTIRDDIVLAIPYGQIIAIVVGAGLAGMIAAVLPARRAAKSSIVTALASE